MPDPGISGYQGTGAQTVQGHKGQLEEDDPDDGPPRTRIGGGGGRGQPARLATPSETRRAIVGYCTELSMIVRCSWDILSQLDGCGESARGSPAHPSVLQPVPVTEGRSDLLRHGVVSVHPGVVGDGPQLGGIDLAVGHDRLVGGDVDDPSDEDLRLLVVTHDLAFGGERELVEHGGVHIGGLRSVESGSGDLVGDVVARDYADIVG